MLFPQYWIEKVFKSTIPSAPNSMEVQVPFPNANKRKTGSTTLENILTLRSKADKAQSLYAGCFPSALPDRSALLCTVLGLTHMECIRDRLLDSS